ncbi:class I SAM-dependent methyltransferase [Solicola gregarius]|uniref:Class I SAM-dependent methyltransferase n=1 Tax=Solicola gregarius TaxID=2908642 RepID=A0AA46YM26_9ACTN|nr:class I SAM-dependent methyltransferase [Solicola gregarius]UYM06224.1 class I SAM-dependent methyltransferase [Solicola gregarius]
MPVSAFGDPRLAALYDPLDPDRSDLDAYAAIAEELRVQTVLDIGCGTGTFACMLSTQGLDVVAIDPAAASVDIARAKPYADRVRWIVGDATVLPPLQVDLATMTANVAQVFITDADWAETLGHVRAALAPGGHLVFETRDPARQAWLEWNPVDSHIAVDVEDVGRVESFHDVTDVSGELVTFRTTTRLADQGETLTSDSTLRFRTREQIEESVRAAGFTVDDVRDAPDRAGRELVFVARS